MHIKGCVAPHMRLWARTYTWRQGPGLLFHTTRSEEHFCVMLHSATFHTVILSVELADGSQRDSAHGLLPRLLQSSVGRGVNTRIGANRRENT